MSAVPHQASSESFAEASRLLRIAALARAIDEPDHQARIVPLLRGRFALRGPTVDLAADTALRDAAAELLSRGWTPREVHTFAARRLDPTTLTYLVDALAATALKHPAAPWRSDLAALPARVWWTVGEPHLGQWALRHRRSRAETIRACVEVLAMLTYLPKTDAPNTAAPPTGAVPPGALVQDARIVGKIDALLARAGSSPYPEEAAACAAKAQQLMVRYATLPSAGAGPGTLSEPRRLIAAVIDEVAALIHRAALGLATRTARPELEPPAHRPLPLPQAVRS